MMVSMIPPRVYPPFMASLMRSVRRPSSCSVPSHRKGEVWVF